MDEDVKRFRELQAEQSQRLTADGLPWRQRRRARAGLRPLHEIHAELAAAAAALESGRD